MQKNSQKNRSDKNSNNRNKPQHGANNNNSVEYRALWAFFVQKAATERENYGLQIFRM
jgi:hypothetical protein